MSLLVLHAVHVENDSPEILSFSDWKPRLEADRNRRAAHRARQEYHNQSCPCCGRTTVEPIELDDYRVNRNGLPVHGTATVVGFSCNACHEMWKG